MHGAKAPFPLAFSHFGPGAPESPALARPEWSHPEGKPTVIRGYHGILYIYISNVICGFGT